MQVNPAWTALLDRLADASYRHYRALVYENPEFLTYFEQATPINEIAQLKIGSRPSRRGTSSSIDQLRAIPWVFAWSQSRANLLRLAQVDDALRARLGELKPALAGRSLRPCG